MIEVECSFGGCCAIQKMVLNDLRVECKADRCKNVVGGNDGKSAKIDIPSAGRKWDAQDIGTR